MPKWMVVMAIAFGIAFLATGLNGFMSGRPILPVIYNIAIGAICIYGTSVQRRLYLSDVGVVREIRAWGRHVRRVLPWSDVKFVSFAFRRADMMVFFEVDITGWKVLFSRDQEDLVRDILDDYIPDVETQNLP